jgi:hypothetical protein
MPESRIKARLKAIQSYFMHSLDQTEHWVLQDAIFCFAFIISSLCERRWYLDICSLISF